MPFIGGLFQPVEGRGTLDEAYDRMTEIQQTKGTYADMVAKGNRAEAKAFAQENANLLSMASTSGAVQKYLGEIAKRERMVRASTTMSTEQKDAQLEKLDQMKTAYARKFIALADRTTPR
jgi:predicted Rossmann-fold nucleotide-binding protein